MYSKITNPKTNRKVNINSKLGINILNNYFKTYYIGGTINQTENVPVPPWTSEDESEISS